MSQENIKRFEEEVLAKNEQLQAQLKATDSKEALLQAYVQLGQENGYSFTAEDVEATIQQQAQGDDAKLSEEELETAAGGRGRRTACIFTGPWCLASC